MVRKRTSLPGEGSKSLEGAGGGQSSQVTVERSGPPPQQVGRGGKGAYRGGRGWNPQAGTGGYSGVQGGPSEYQGRVRGWRPQQGFRQQHPGVPSEHQGRGRCWGPEQGGHGSFSGGHVGGGVGSRGVGQSGGPSRPQLPELHHAAPVPHQAGMISQPAISEASSSRVQEESHLDIQKQDASALAIPIPSSNKSVRFASRPGRGSNGIKCVVKANHFIAELPNKDLHQYAVAIKPEVASRGVKRAVMSQLVHLYKDSHLAGRQPAYDGQEILYTAGPLPFQSQEFQITLINDNDSSGAQRRERVFQVVIKFAARRDLHHLGLFLQGRQTDTPLEAPLQALDIVLREVPTKIDGKKWYFPVGRSFYFHDQDERQSLGEGLESWRGFYQSFRPTQMGLSLNIDMSSTAFIEALPVVDFVKQLLNSDVSSRPLSYAESVKVKKALHGVKVEVTHRGNMRRKYRISGLSPQTTGELTFPVDEQGTMKYVVDYFYDRYDFVIQHTQWPCLLLGNQQRPTYLPMEVCKIVEGQRYSKRLNERQITALLKVTCQQPHKREEDILKTGRHNAQHNALYDEFGIKISDELAQVEARILPAPWFCLQPPRAPNSSSFSIHSPPASSSQICLLRFQNNFIFVSVSV